MPQTGLNESFTCSAPNAACDLKAKAPLMPAALHQNSRTLLLLFNRIPQKFSDYSNFLDSEAIFWYFYVHDYPQTQITKNTYL